MGLSCAAFAWLAFTPYRFGTGEYVVHPAIVAMFLFLAFFTGSAASAAFDAWRDAFRCGIRKSALLAVAAGYTAAAHVFFADAPLGGALIGLLGFPAIWVFYYLAYKFLARVMQAMFSGGQKPARYEIVFIALAVLCAAGFAWAAFMRHPILYDGTGEGLSGDIIYMFDNPYHIEHDSFFISFGGANDFRNIFFGLFSWPVVLPLRIASDIARLVGGFNAYPYLVAAAQHVAMALSAVLFGRMAAKTPWGRAGFLLLYAASYPVLLNVLILEQYAFPVFWMASFLYAWLRLDDDALMQMSCLAGSGCLVSSAAMLAPVFLYDRERAKKHTGNIFIAAMGILCTSGQTAALLYAMFSMRRTLLFFGANVGMGSRLKQFTVFLRSLFLQPQVKLFLAPVNQFLNDHEYPAYGLSNDIAFSAVGIAVLCIVILGAALNYKDKFSVSCAWWCAVSVLILVMAGWGSYENGYVIYSLYFGWAFVALSYKLLETVLGRWPKMLFGACACLSAGMLLVNMPGISGMLSFLGQYYPV